MGTGVLPKCAEVNKKEIVQDLCTAMIYYGLWRIIWWMVIQKELLL